MLKSHLTHVFLSQALGVVVVASIAYSNWISAPTQLRMHGVSVWEAKGMIDTTDMFTADVITDQWAQRYAEAEEACGRVQVLRRPQT